MEPVVVVNYRTLRWLMLTSAPILQRTKTYDRHWSSIWCLGSLMGVICHRNWITFELSLKIHEHQLNVQFKDPITGLQRHSVMRQQSSSDFQQYIAQCFPKRRQQWTPEFELETPEKQYRVDCCNGISLLYSYGRAQKQSTTFCALRFTFRSNAATLELYLAHKKLEEGCRAVRAVRFGCKFEKMSSGRCLELFRFENRHSKG